MLSAPASSPPTTDVNFGVGLAAPDRTSSLVNVTCSSSRSDNPDCSASSQTGTSPAADTRFGSSNTAAARPQACDNSTESVLPIQRQFGPKQTYCRRSKGTFV